LGFILVGGTALALQMGHRTSEDIDLFTNNDIDKKVISGYIDKTFGENRHIINNSERIVQIVINGIKVDFVHVEDKLIMYRKPPAMPGRLEKAMPCRA
jgi:predicted nucleotidyltransferase